MADPIAPSDAWRAKAPGKFVTASYGRLHYQMKKPDGESRGMVLCLHGFSTDGTIYAEMLDTLCGAGYTAVAMDTYGRGYSDAAPEHTKYDDRLLVTMVAEFLMLMRLETDDDSVKKIDLIGYSMGGGLAVAFAERFPDQVSSLFLIAPSGLPVHMPLSTKMLHIPLVGSLAFHFGGRNSLLKHAAAGYYKPESKEAQDHLLAIRMRLCQLFEEHPGYSTALLSSARYFPFGGLEHAYRAIASTDVRTSFVWGKEDTTVPYKEHMPTVEYLFPSGSFTSVPRAAHSDLFVMPDAKKAMAEALAAHFNVDD